MMKRRRLNSPPHKDKVSNTENVELRECCVSRLPDDIIDNIFSRLNLLEAARTSVVSSNWRYFWTFTANLDFHAPKTIWDIDKKIGEHPNVSEIEEKRSKYINWKSYITNWIHIALAKGVQNLELNFDRFVGIIWKDYSFPVECYNTLKSPHGLSIIKSLRSLSLNSVDVNTEIVEFFIYNCPHLERLSVFDSKTLLSLKVAGSSIQLKHLDIECCHSIKEVDMSSPSLLSFKYHGPQIRLHVKNVPLLLDVSIGGSFHVQLRNLIDPIIPYLLRLETLELHLNLIELICDGGKRRKLRQFPKCSLGYLIDLEPAFYFFKNAPMLKKMIVNPTSPYSIGSYFKFENSERKQAARKRVKQLKRRVPQGVQLVEC
ncbi:hypothetical protein LWI29_016307 [Acer saccharum]|uniref:F-box domain-containing protein n=1 Tax=Acer saccharum TaxID=4024 RepID=A0AA39S845_ACESA|nr:hypothetical protein LWI29_016307 [Acer saccharum]